MRSLPVSRLLGSVAAAQQVTFVLGGKVVNHLMVFDSAAYLPAVAYYAEALAQETIGWSIGVRLKKDAESVFGVRVEPQVIRAENHFQGTLTGLMYLRGADICFNWKKNGQVDLKEVYDRMASAMSPLIQAQSDRSN